MKLIREKFQFEEYNHKKYRYGQGHLEVGDEVMVHPTSNSISRKPYLATITSEYMIFNGRGQNCLCTHVDGGYSAVINDYLFNRLEKV